MVPAIPIAIGAGMAAGGIAGSFFGKKKTQPIDISQQLARVQGSYDKQNRLNTDLSANLNPLTQGYKADLQAALGQEKTDFAGNKQEYLGSTDANTKAAQDALRANLYSTTFNALPDTLQAVREASAAGGGLNTGSYQKAVNDVGRTTAQTIGQGERDIQVQGLQNKQGAQENAFNAFNQLSGKMTDQQLQGLTKVLDTGREDLVRQYTTSMGLSEAETQSIVDLLNFQASGNLASQTAADANQQALYNALIGGGSTMMGSYAGKAAVTPKPKGI